MILAKKRSLFALALLLALFVLAAFLRLYRLESIPPGLHGDEAQAGIIAQRVLSEGWQGPYLHAWGLGAPAGTVYVLALLFVVLNPSITAVRLAPALLGIATVPLMFLLGRRMFGTRAGLLAMALLTFSYWHIHFSRVNYAVIPLPLVEVAALYFLFQGLQEGKALSFAVSGLFLGLSVYTYHPFVLFLGAVAVVVVYVTFKQGGRWRYFGPRVALLTTVALAVSLPFLALVVQEGLPARFRNPLVFNSVEFQALGSLGERAGFLLGRAFQAGGWLFQGGAKDGVDALGGRGLLDPVTALLFVGGMALSLRRVRDERYLLLLVGVGLSLLGSILSTGGEGQYRRIISGLPFIILAAAIFGDGLLQVIERWAPRFNRVLPPLLLAGGLAFVGYWNVDYYFRVLTTSSHTRWVFVEDLVEAVHYLETLEPDTYVYFLSGRWSWNYETRRFLLPDMEGEDRSKEFGSFSLERDREGPVVYVLLPPYEDQLAELEARYPGGRAWEVKEGEGRVVFRAYFLGPTEGL